MASYTRIECIILDRFDTAADWTSANPTLMENQIGYETDTGKRKRGDGVTAWTSLAYLDYPATVSASYVSKTANYTTLGTDDIIDCTSGTFDITLITAVGRAGKIQHIKNSGTGLITMKTTSAQTIDGIASGVLVLDQYTSLSVVSDGVNWKIIGNRPA